MFKKIPAAALSADLKRFKQMMELGEITVSDSTAVEGMHPAQPPAPGTLKPELRR